MILTVFLFHRYRFWIRAFCLRRAPEVHSVPRSLPTGGMVTQRLWVQVLMWAELKHWFFPLSFRGWLLWLDLNRCMSVYAVIVIVPPSGQCGNAFWAIGPKLHTLHQSLDLNAVIVIAPPTGQCENEEWPIGPKILSHDQRPDLNRCHPIIKSVPLSKSSQPVSLSLSLSLSLSGSLSLGLSLS